MWRSYRCFSAYRSTSISILVACAHAAQLADVEYVPPPTVRYYIVVHEPEVKRTISEYSLEKQQNRIRLRMGFPAPNYAGVAPARD